MDNPKPPQKPEQLLNDLESIRELLGDKSFDPPVLMDSLDPDSIPLLSDIVTPSPRPLPATPAKPTAMPGMRDAVAHGVSQSAELNRLDSELRAAAQLILQDVIDDFVPQIEAELKRRLSARLSRLLPPRK